ncbi:hypothetical protein PS876_03981 [Pseudomonas fluorescens]|uniref:hypothetical protein n=1 Tax=Pseudomonas fluorescens TaxID=294 RepID=UPI001241468E|nr:hypothetical protein [Pseudomonas fluorescens]VVP24061.1 hypothetical protein PS876_03981 [Pseudomonas fluorescens]
MANLGKLWAGRAFGTNTGNLSIIFEKDGEELDGVVRFRDDEYGLVTYKIQGTYKDEVVLTGKAITETEGVEYAELTVKAALTPEGSLKGEWYTSAGSGGPFVAHMHDVGAANTDKTNLDIEQFYTQGYTLGALRLAKDDVISLMEAVKKDFNAEAKLVVTYRSAGAEVTQHEKDFLALMGGHKKLTYLKVYMQEPDEFGVNKFAFAELAEPGFNRVVAQGVREVWVEGKAQMLRSELAKNEKSIITNFKKFGLNLNQVALFVMIVAITYVPEFWMKAVVGILVFGLIKFIGWLHVTFIPNASIRLTDIKETWITRWGSSIFSWVATLASTVLGGYLIYVLTKTTS